MAITIITGDPGAGKTSFMTHLLIEEFFKAGDELLEKCQEDIIKENEERLYPLPLPDKPPIFTNYGVKFYEDYEKEYSPYFINPYYFGVRNEETSVQYLLPNSRIFIEECQRYFDSRQSTSFPRRVSEAFEMHRHFGLEIYLDAQRGKLVDLNIRGIASRILRIEGTENKKNKYGGILSTTWKIREFESNAELMQYYDTGIGGHEIEPVTHKGNIFEAFDSKKNRKAFYPPDKPQQAFTLLDFYADKENAPAELKMYYDTNEPKWFRHKEKETA